MHSKSRARLSGPLEPFIAGFDAELARLGYTPAGTRRKLEAVAHLSCWLAERGMTAYDIGTEAIDEFVAARRAAGHASQLTGRSLAWMLDYLRGFGAVRPAEPGPAAGAGQLLERFGTFLADERGLAAKTRGAHLDPARRFLEAAGRAGEAGLPVSTLTASDVTAFLAGMARIQAPGRRHAAAAALACPSFGSKNVTPHVLRHSCAVRMLRSGIDIAVIALWLGHESTRTTMIYLKADLELKQRTLDRTVPVDGEPGRYRPPDNIIDFLDHL